MKKITTLLVSILVIVACSSSGSQRILIKDMDPKLKDKGSTILKDIIKSFKHDEGARYLLNTNYLSKKLEIAILNNSKAFATSYLLQNISVGNISKYQLIKVMDKGIVKSLYYKLTSDSKFLELAELRIDVNADFKLVRYALIITTDDGKFVKKNIMPSY